ncbi:hypothetical protein HCEG_05028 [Histoplasma capsulatum var. duboisii H88]|uniref:Uncharacterized protein n=2 Tax=Ajellomyces capsulatus (strain H88) TaxID=544711 RepID=F0UJS0_AJEC8|nr:hypothetical protein HCEG_05028 [Histoplasma capsulatum var. duboisii H88]
MTSGALTPTRDNRLNLGNLPSQFSFQPQLHVSSSRKPTTRRIPNLRSELLVTQEFLISIVVCRGQSLTFRDLLIDHHGRGVFGGSGWLSSARIARIPKLPVFLNAPQATRHKPPKGMANTPEPADVIRQVFFLVSRYFQTFSSRSRPNIIQTNIKDGNWLSNPARADTLRPDCNVQYRGRNITLLT